MNCFGLFSLEEAIPPGIGVLLQEGRKERRKNERAKERKKGVGGGTSLWNGVRFATVNSQTDGQTDRQTPRQTGCCYEKETTGQDGLSCCCYPKLQACICSQGSALFCQPL